MLPRRLPYGAEYGARQPGLHALAMSELMHVVVDMRPDVVGRAKSRNRLRWQIERPVDALSPSESRQTPPTRVQYCQTPHHEHGATDGSARIDLRGGHGRLGGLGRVATDGYPADHFATCERLRGTGRTVAARRGTARARCVVWIADTLDASDSRNNSACVGRGRHMRRERLKSRLRRRDAMKRRSTMNVGGNALDRVHLRYRERVAVHRKKGRNQHPFLVSHRIIPRLASCTVHPGELAPLGLICCGVGCS